MYSRAAGADCTQPLKSTFFTLLSTGGGRECLLFLRLLRELGEGGGKLSSCVQESDAPIRQTSFWQCRICSQASVFEELPYLTCFRKQHKSKRKAGWSCVALSVNTSILFLEYNWKMVKIHLRCSVSQLHLPWIIRRCSSFVFAGPYENTTGFCFTLCHPLWRMQKYFYSASPFVLFLFVCLLQLGIVMSKCIFY